MSKVDEAAACFSKGFNCSQAVLSTYCEQFGLDRETALKLAGPFGGCMARKVEVCGAVSAAYMLIGLKYGKYLPEDKASQEKCYQVSKVFTDQFNEIHGSVHCCNLIKSDISTPEGLKYITENSLWETLCPIFLRDVCQLIEVLLEL